VSSSQAAVKALKLSEPKGVGCASAHLSKSESPAGNHILTIALPLHIDQTGQFGQREDQMKGLIAWFMGVPLLVIILLYFFGYF
jgi:ABC-type amino acid transport system permease subunit